MRGKWVLLSVSAILLAIAAGALSLLRKPATPQSAQKAVPAPPPPIPDEALLSGKIQAAHILPVHSPTDGILDRWNVQVGEEVLEGQPLGHVRNTMLEAAAEQARSDLESAQSKVTSLEGQILAARLDAARAEADAARARVEVDRLEKIYLRQQMLLREGATPRLVFEKAEREYKTAAEESKTASELAKSTADRVQSYEKDLQLAKSTVQDRQDVLDSANSDLESSNILSPADGAVLKLGVEPGGEVTRGMEDLIQLAVDPALLQVVVEPDPRLLERIKPGMPALVVVPDFSSDGITGDVKEIKGAQVIVEFTSPNPAIKHGMLASVRIPLK
jgi:HlyD family secretion protein